MKKISSQKDVYFDRDLSWLAFNDRVLAEAQRKVVPLMERLKFLSIYSSNLDEFYRVRVPALTALDRLDARDNKEVSKKLLRINRTIQQQLRQFGKTLRKNILPELLDQGVNLLINKPLPKNIKKEVEEYFFGEVAGFLHIIELNEEVKFFPGNNKIYFLVALKSRDGATQFYVVNIPSDQISRFYRFSLNNSPCIVFLDDIIKTNIDKIFPEHTLISCNSFKVTRDAELDLKDEFEGNLAKKIEHEISRRDFGLATRFLYDPNISPEALDLLSHYLGLQKATFVNGGTYHNLKDLATLPLKNDSFLFDPWPSAKFRFKQGGKILFDFLKRKEILLHTPYQSYDTVLRFFNEAALDPHVKRIYVTLYRIAKDSRIAHAMINAARNGKKVTVFVELKARFDEENNIKWARRMKEAGVDILYSIPELKVHAKLALVKRKKDKKTEYFGLLSTGNFNEGTARFYTDHILMTSDQRLLLEAENLFRFLRKRRKPANTSALSFNHLLVAQFNLQHRFLTLINREIDFAKKGIRASIVIKLNNLEEPDMISKLYEASRAGVNIALIVRGICCLVPGVKGMSENISVRRIIDRYLEHGRIFVFNNNGKPEIFMGSADWMTRNIHRRIEVCFPIYDKVMKEEIKQLLEIQLKDNVQAVNIDQKGNNIPVLSDSPSTDIQSQKVISDMLNITRVNATPITAS